MKGVLSIAGKGEGVTGFGVVRASRDGERGQRTGPGPSLHSPVPPRGAVGARHRKLNYPGCELLWPDGVGVWGLGQSKTTLSERRHLDLLTDILPRKVAETGK